MLNYCWLYRMIWICGRFGGGKTSLGVQIARWLTSKGYARYVASNIQLNVGTVVRVVSPADLRRYDCKGPVFRDMVILFDEAWQNLGKGASRKEIISWLAFMRKGNNFLIMPSVLPLVQEVNVLKVERFFNGMALGVPVWLYRWNLGDHRKGGDRGWYMFSNPSQVFGFYDTTAIPSEDFTIYDTWQAEAEAEEDNRFVARVEGVVDPNLQSVDSGGDNRLGV